MEGKGIRPGYRARDHNLGFRLSADEDRRFRENARRSGGTMTDYFVSLIDRDTLVRCKEQGG